jgi:ABC-type antimicrobial peptide transport system permease subunit
VKVAFADSDIPAFSVPGGQMMAVVVVGIIAGVLAAARPARRAAKRDPLAAIAMA